MRKVGAAAGYYDLVARYRIDPAQDPWRVVVQAEPGEPYKLAEVRVVLPDGGTPPLADRLDAKVTGLVLGERAIASAVIAADERIAGFYAERGWPFARIARRRAEIDATDHTMHVTYTVDVGVPARFGPTAVDGLQTVERAFVERQIAWRRGDTFDRRLLDKTRNTLVQSKLFSTVRVEPDERVDASGQVAIRVGLVERLHRSVRGGVFYNSSEGFGTRASWEHRNFFGQSESLKLQAEAGQSRYGVLGEFRRPAFLRPDLDLLAQLSGQQEMVDAYDRSIGTATLGLEQRLTPRLVGGIGVQLELAQVTDGFGRTTYGYAGLPLHLRYDSTDSVLNPTRGARIGLTTTPYAAYLGDDLAYLSGRLSASTYLGLDAEDRFVLAGFGAIGTTVGVTRDRLQRDKRLYSGGGALRAYGFQRVGPLDANGDPLGGIAQLEVGVELRAKVTETIGLVTFLEGGNVYEDLLPDLDRGLFRGAGLGVRYYSPVGPIRLDLAFPLDRRPSDAAFQIYVSIGQAF